MESATDLEAAIEDSDCVVIVTDHAKYDFDEIRHTAPLVVDTRRALKRKVSRDGGRARP